MGWHVCHENPLVASKTINADVFIQSLCCEQGQFLS